MIPFRFPPKFAPPVLFLWLTTLNATGCYLLRQPIEVSPSVLAGNWVTHHDFRKNAAGSGTYVPVNLELHADDTFELRNMPTCWADTDVICTDSAVSYTGTLQPGTGATEKLFIGAGPEPQ